MACTSVCVCVCGTLLSFAANTPGVHSRAPTSWRQPTPARTRTCTRTRAHAARYTQTHTHREREREREREEGGERERETPHTRTHAPVCLLRARMASPISRSSAAMDRYGSDVSFASMVATQRHHYYYDCYRTRATRHVSHDVCACSRRRGDVAALVSNRSFVGALVVANVGGWQMADVVTAVVDGHRRGCACTRAPSRRWFRHASGFACLSLQEYSIMHPGVTMTAVSHPTWTAMVLTPRHVRSAPPSARSTRQSFMPACLASRASAMHW